jgi:ERCC4-related helicase
MNAIMLSSFDLILCYDIVPYDIKNIVRNHGLR